MSAAASSSSLAPLTATAAATVFFVICVVSVVVVTRAAMPVPAVLARSTDDSSTRSNSCKGSDRGVDATPTPASAPEDDDADDSGVVGSGDSSKRPLCITMASAPAVTCKGWGLGEY